MLQGVPTGSDLQAATLPKLPSEETANMLLESAYMYTQSRWCLVDWVRVREWHRQRETICYSVEQDDHEAQMGLDTKTTRPLSTQKLTYPSLHRGVLCLDHLRSRSWFCPNP